MYACDACGAVFREPHIERDYSPDYGDCSECFCPECGESIRPEEVDECPECHGWKRMQDTMCRKCRLATVSEFKLANRGFSRIQLDYITDLAEGMYLSDFVRGEET